MSHINKKILTKQESVVKYQQMSDECLRQSANFLRENIENIDEIYVEQAVIGLFYTGIKLSVGTAGLAFTPIKDIPEAVCCPSSAARMPAAGQIRGSSVTKILDYISEPGVLKHSVAVAALNALTSYYISKSSTDVLPFKIHFDSDAAFELDFEKLEPIVVVGALIPYIKRLKRTNKEFYIIEKDKRTLKGDELTHFVSYSDSASVLRRAAAAIITGAAIVNGTIDSILDELPENCLTVITGPTASMYPLPFFARGVKAMGGLNITDPDTVMQILMEGGSGYHIFGKYSQKITFTPLE